MLRRVLAAATTGLLVTLGGALPAHGASLNLVDDRGDVHRATAPEEFQPAPGERRADIVRTTLRHTQRGLAVRTKLVELTQQSGAVGVQMRMRTNDGTYRLLSLDASRRGGWSGQTTLMARDGQSVDCQTEHHIDYAADVITVQIPASCLNAPRWIQATVVSYFSGRRNLLVDNPHNNKGRANVWSTRIRRG